MKIRKVKDLDRCRSTDLGSRDRAECREARQMRDAINQAFSKSEAPPPPKMSGGWAFHLVTNFPILKNIRWLIILVTDNGVMLMARV